MDNSVTEQTALKGKKRIGYFDIAKGFAMLSIIISHSVGADLVVNTDSNLLISFLFSFHVPIFFVISGYFYKNNPGNVKKYTIRLIKPYVFTCCCMVVIDILHQCYMHIFFFNSNFLWDILSVFSEREMKAFFGGGERAKFFGVISFEAIGAIWFFLALIWSVVFFAQIEKVNKIKKLKQPWTNAVELFLVLMLFGLGLIICSFTGLPFSILPGMVSEIFFFVGFKYKEIRNEYDFIKKYFAKKWFRIVIFMISVAVWTVDIIYCYKNGIMSLSRSFFSNVFINVSGAFAAAYVIITIFKYMEKHNIFKHLLTFFKFIGQNTVVVLCFHLLDVEYFKWNFITDNLAFFGAEKLIIIIILKIIWCCLGVAIVNRVKILKKVFN